MIPHQRVFSLNAEAGGYQSGVFSQNVTLQNAAEEIDYLSVFIQYWCGKVILTLIPDSGTNVEPMKLNYFKINNKYLLITSDNMYVVVVTNSYSETMQMYLLYFFICEHFLLNETIFLCSTSRLSFCSKNIFLYKSTFWCTNTKF